MTSRLDATAPAVGPRTSVAAPGAARSWLFVAPHRLAFACGATLLAVASIAWWATTLAIWLGHAPRPALPLFEIHGLVMVFGFLPFFFTGFLFTAVPKWLGVRAPAARDLGGGLGAQVAGWVVFGIGASSPDPAFAAALGGAGLAAVAFGSTALWLRFVALLRRSRAQDRWHAGMLAATGAIGVIALWAAAAGVATAWHPLVRAATQAALWLFVGGTFATAAHRLIPFVGVAAFPRLDAWRPLWLLAALLGLFGLEGLWAAADASTWPLPTAIRLARAGVELAAGLGVGLLALRWARVLDLRIRLVAMLYAGFAWLAASFVLAGLSHLSGTATDGATAWSAAPLHAFTMGFVGSTLLAMLTRITCAQAGRALVADDVLWRLFWLLQATVALRLGAALAAHAGQPSAWPLIVVAAGGWALLWLGWALRYVPWLTRPRQDGRPG